MHPESPRVVSPPTPRQAIKNSYMLLLLFASLCVISFTMRGVVTSLANVMLRFDLNTRLQPSYKAPGGHLPLVSLRGLQPTRLEFAGEIACAGITESPLNALVGIVSQRTPNGTRTPSIFTAR
jgi:cyanate permease